MSLRRLKMLLTDSEGLETNRWSRAQATITGLVGLVLQAISVSIVSSDGVEIVYEVSSRGQGSSTRRASAHESCEYASYGVGSTFGWVMGLALVQFLVQENVRRIKSHKLSRSNKVAVVAILVSMAIEGLKACRLLLREATVAWSYVGGCFLGILAGVIVEGLVDYFCLRGNPGDEKQVETTAMYVRLYTKWGIIGSSLASNIVVWHTVGNRWSMLTVVEPFALILGSMRITFRKVSDILPVAESVSEDGITLSHL